MNDSPGFQFPPDQRPESGAAPGGHVPGHFDATIHTGNPALEREERLHEFYTALFTLTPRVFVTHILVAINVVLFLLMVIGEPKAFLSPTIPTLLNWGASFGPLTLNGQPWRIFTCMFVHIGILHLALNMWALWVSGPLLERLVGNVGFLVLYVVAGLCGSLASVAWNSDIVSGGASGAIFGLFGALLGFLVLGRGSMPAEVVTTFRNNALMLIGINLLLGFQIQGIDNAGHLGGVIGGCLCGVLLGQPVTLQAANFRWLRNLLVAVLGVAVVAGGLAAIPPPADVQGAEENFFAVEGAALEKFRSLIEKAQGGTLPSEEFIKTIENEILPPWIAARQRFEKLNPVPERFQAIIAAYIKYMQAREDFWKYLVQSERTPDPNSEQRVAEHNAAIEQSLAEVKRIGDEMRQPK